MAELAKKDEIVTREEWLRDDAVAYFQGIGEHYKAEIIASIQSNEPIRLSREGDFIDLCRGPHVPSTGKLKVFLPTKSDRKRFVSGKSGPVRVVPGGRRIINKHKH